MTAFIRSITLSELNALSKNTLMQTLAIEFTDIGQDFIEAKMPVDSRTHQVYGILHGGASVALAETLGSVGAMLSIDTNRFRCVGVEINANHIRPVSQGFVKGIAKPIHVGKSTHVWEIKMYDDQKKLTCISRITVAILPLTK